VALTDINLNNYGVPVVSLLGSSGNSYNTLLDTIAIGKLDTSVIILGCVQAALDDAIRYAKETNRRSKALR
jgi:alkylation response protein AidB-like acyl-CoA dehydrogenase